MPNPRPVRLVMLHSVEEVRRLADVTRDYMPVAYKWEFDGAGWQQTEEHYLENYDLHVRKLP